MGARIAALMLVEIAAVGLLPVDRGGGVVLGVGIFSEGGRLAEGELMVVSVVVLLATIVLVGVGVVEDAGRRNSVTKNTSRCDRESILLRTFAEPTNASWLSSCGRSSPRVVFKNKTIAVGEPILLQYLTWISVVKDLHSGDPGVVFGNRTLPEKRSLVWWWLLPKNIIAQTRRTNCLTRWALSFCCGPYISDGITHSVGC